MELQEIQNIWREYDKKLEKHVQLNLQILKKMNLDKTKSFLNDFIKTPVLGIAIGFFLMLSLGVFIYSHSSIPNLVMPAVVLELFVLLQIIFSIYQTSIIMQIDYNSPITKLQSKLGLLNLRRTQYLSVTRFSYALLWLPALIIGLEVFWGYDLYSDLNRTWLISTVTCGIAFTVFGVWISVRLADRGSTSRLIKWWMNNFSKNDITGKGLYSAITFLNDIEDFEEEKMTDHT